ncbi:HlyD family secretion protein [Methylovirgula sp. 4M-Z18]|uniref:HlyD family secretion protein n=1 Tax=Methylovirgula sp. 4M-Z18 TaxID=2293567 RepID=UPI000E2FEC19|nr:HlyD family secretion protein [Methylovirgula sp. 4M-Z18]RFB79882.1 HlyD family secretion protein [Methylovirgula sp. 4M-Z18]
MSEGTMALRNAGDAEDDIASSNVTNLAVVADARRTTAEQPQTNPTPETTATPARPVRAAAPQRPKRKLARPLLFLLLPVALVVGGYSYVNGGQVISIDNAYVQADTLGVSTDVSGTVVAIEVQDNQQVTKGQVLFRLRPDSFQTAVDGAQAQLGTVRNQILTLQASYAQALVGIQQAEADLPYFQTVLKRQQDLIATNAASKAAYDDAVHNVESTKQRIAVAKAQAQSMLAQLGNDANQPVEQNPFYLQAQAAVDDAKRDLRDTVVRAPFNGIVTNVSHLQIGSYLPAAQPGFSLVSSDHLWVMASPKETELTHVVPGQSVTVTVDTYPGVEWKGSVDSISPASGSSFSLLPAQNTTGNWVKVVQRIPMRIDLGDLSGKPQLRVGMSVVADIDTHHARGLPQFVTDLLGKGKSQE